MPSLKNAISVDASVMSGCGIATFMTGPVLEVLGCNLCGSCAAMVNVAVIRFGVSAAVSRALACKTAWHGGVMCLLMRLPVSLFEGHSYEVLVLDSSQLDFGRRSCIKCCFGLVRNACF